MNEDTIDVQSRPAKGNFGLIMTIYLAGIFMGAIDTGIVTPARTIIQSQMGVDAQTGIWMITIYTLAYAAAVPIMGKLADKFGRKYIYIICITLFGLGSLFCGLSESFGGFPLLIIARVVQAVGGGGIVPIATAEFGTTFPKEKRGMALGLVGGVYGIANVFGASAGSAILDIFGTDNWSFIFYINVPISLFIVVCGLICLGNTRTDDHRPIDILGITTLTVMILSVLYGLKQLDFFDFANSIRTTDVYPFLIVFIVLVPVFILIEKKAADPVINLGYFTNKNILITLLLSFVSGFVMMGVIFVPQFSENALKLATGSGGYLVIILGIFAGVGAPASGKLIDKFGAKIILAFGFAMSIIGALFMSFVATAHPGMLTIFIGLMLCGLGMGFTMGTPVNYMMLDHTEEKESNSALATLSLVRSIGTAIAPAIMVGFIANAGMLVQTNVMDLLPKEINVPQLPYTQEITEQVNALKANPNTKDKLEDVNLPDFSAMEKVEISMNANPDVEMPSSMVELMQTSDVTTISKNTMTMATVMFNEMKPNIIGKIQDGISKGTKGISIGITQMETARNKLISGYDGIGKGIAGMEKAIAGQKQALVQLQQVSEMMGKMGGRPMPPGTSIADMIPAPVKSKIPANNLAQLAKITSVEQLNGQIKGLESSIKTMNLKVETNKSSQDQMKTAITSMDETLTDMKTLNHEMTVMNNAVPSTFDKALDDYLGKIKALSSKIEKVFQDTLNKGFKNIYMTTVIAAAMALVLLMFYRDKFNKET